jgi:hypothetical protein
LDAAGPAEYCARCDQLHPSRHNGHHKQGDRAPRDYRVVTLDDERLADAMRKEGFALVDIAAE